MIAPRTLAVLALPGVLLVSEGAGAIDAREAVAAFVARLGNPEVRDLTIEQSFTIYEPDGRHRQSSGEHRIFMKPPRRQRLEQTVDGQREIRITAGDRAWIRRPDGVTQEAPVSPRERASAAALMTGPRGPDELLAVWRALGIRTDVVSEARLRGRTVTVIGAAAGDRASPAVWLDPDVGVVRMINRESLQGMSALVDVTFSEHRRTPEALAFPWRQEIFVDGKLVALITVRAVAVNTDLPDALFDPDALRRGR
ncbi:MAG: hypothetical protein HYR86_10215 [Candidatus Rokubacteria bacterium]|nr:hypothetical protein [Candidatus Rokubacteria bacterium]